VASHWVCFVLKAHSCIAAELIIVDVYHIWVHSVNLGTKVLPQAKLHNHLVGHV